MNRGKQENHEIEENLLKAAEKLQEVVKEIELLKQKRAEEALDWSYQIYHQQLQKRSLKLSCQIWGMLR